MIPLPLHVCLSLLLTATVMAAEPMAAVPGAHGWLLCLSTDQPQYQPGDTLSGRVLILDAVTFTPSAPPLSLRIRLVSPAGHDDQSLNVTTRDSIAAFAWKLPAHQAEGTYRVAAEALGQPATPAERVVLIGGERIPQLALDLRLPREDWAPGETVTAELLVHDHAGRPRAGAAVTARASVDGATVLDRETTLAADGTVQLAFTVPPQPFRRAFLTVTVDDHGTIERISRILHPQQSPRIDFSSESGHLIARIENRLYLQVMEHSGQPLPFAGTIVDDHDLVVATVNSEHEGRARCVFTPGTGQRYRLRLGAPIGITTTFPLPPAEDRGIVLHAADDQIAAGAPARLVLTATADASYRIEIRRRGEVVATQDLSLVAYAFNAISIALPEATQGVLVATVLDHAGQPCAERLLYRAPRAHLHLTVTADRPRYQRGEDASVTVSVRDAEGRPVAAQLAVAVVDAGTFSALPARERPPRLPVIALLENETDSCADPTRYLDPTGDGSALDLLLGTQEWRRFAAQRGPETLAANGHGLAARRVLMMQRIWPAWPLMLPADAGAPSPGLSSRHRGLPATPSDVAGPSALPPPNGVTDEALSWNRRSQQPDGHWSPGLPAEDAARDAQRSGIAAWSGADADRSATALTVLTYLGAGYDHKSPNKYLKTVSTALAWLMAQAPAGRASDDPSVQGVVTCCLCEAYAMTNDQALKTWCQQAVAVVRAQQIQWQGQRLGWPARADDAPVCDGEASMWAVFALKSALAGGLDIGDGLEGAKRYLGFAWAAANGSQPLDVYTGLSTFPTRWDPRSGACHQPHAPAVGMVMGVFLGHHAGDPLLETLANHAFARYLTSTPPVPLLESYWTTLGLFQAGGERWTRWNRSWRDLLLRLQDSSNTRLRGSWDPLLFDDFAANGGRTITTAIATLSLEIYYRYMHIDGPDRPGDGARRDFHGTLLWSADTRSDPRSGLATLHFRTSDRYADFRILVDGVDAQGAFGITDALVTCGSVMELDAPLPRHLRLGDALQIPIAIHDHDASPATTATLHIDAQPPVPVAMNAGLGRHLAPFVPTVVGTTTIDLRAEAADRQDSVHQTIAVGELGFPWRTTAAGTLAGPSPQASEAAFTIPADLRTGSQHTTVTLMPSWSARITASLDALLREPHGCFEQVSTTSYPLAMAERFARTRHDVAPALRAQMHTLLAEGLQQLASFECPDGGFSWFGKAPGHPALTAFGLMQFRDLTEVLPVDPALLTRTRAWLLNQRTDAGVFALADDQPAWGRECANSYITWALLESSDDTPALTAQVTKALDAVAHETQHSDNAFLIALGGNALWLAGRRDAARAAAQRLQRDEGGGVSGATSSLLSNHAQDARLQASALALLLWTRMDKPALAAAVAGFLQGQCVDGAFGTTQNTVLALRALAAYEAIHKPSAGQATAVMLTIDGQPAGVPVAIAADADQQIRVDLPRLAPGAHRLGLRQDGTRTLPWTLAVSGATGLPPERAEGLSLQTHLAAAQAALGAPVELTIIIATASERTTPIARIGIPAGLRPMREALDALVRDGLISAWEQRDDELVLYWVHLAADDPLTLTIPCVAEHAGRFAGPPSSVYGYYEAHLRAWAEPLTIVVAPPAGW